MGSGSTKSAPRLIVGTRVLLQNNIISALPFLSIDLIRIISEYARQPMWIRDIMLRQKLVVSAINGIAVDSQSKLYVTTKIPFGSPYSTVSRIDPITEEVDHLDPWSKAAWFEINIRMLDGKECMKLMDAKTRKVDTYGLNGHRLNVRFKKQHSRFSNHIFSKQDNCVYDRRFLSPQQAEIRVFDCQSRHTRTFTVDACFDDQLAHAISLDRQGHLLIATQNDVLVYSKDGQRIDSFLGDFDRAHGICVDSKSELVYVVDSGHRRIRIFDY